MLRNTSQAIRETPATSMAVWGYLITTVYTKLLAKEKRREKKKRRQERRGRRVVVQNKSSGIQRSSSRLGDILMPIGPLERHEDMVSERCISRAARNRPIMANEQSCLGAAPELVLRTSTRNDFGLRILVQADVGKVCKINAAGAGRTRANVEGRIICNHFGKDV